MLMILFLTKIISFMYNVIYMKSIAFMCIDQHGPLIRGWRSQFLLL